jgi:hypothetical protein
MEKAIVISRMAPKEFYQGEREGLIAEILVE